MLFSVVIPTFNRAEYLPAALDSVFAQTFRDYELIVVDNASTDGTAAFLATMAGRLLALNHPAPGAGGARNAGAARACGEYLAFLDSDDVWAPWALATFARVIEEQRRPSIVAAAVVEFTSAEPPSVPETPLRIERFDDLLASASSATLIGSGIVAIKREVFAAAEGFTTLPINGEDLDLLLRIGDSPGFVRILAPPMLIWRRHAGGATRDVERALAGGSYLIDQESRGRFPGGTARSAERRDLVSRLIRPLTFHGLREGRIATACVLYWRTLPWHLQLGRWKYLVGFPLSVAGAWLRDSARTSAA